MKTSIKGIELIKGFESFEKESYQDSGGIWTIGWGTTVYPDGKKVGENQTCTIAEAEKWIQHDLLGSEEKVNKWVKVDLLQHQFDALVSFAYNVGYGKTLFEKVNAKASDAEIWSAFMMYINVKGKPLLGLKRRRNAEAHLFVKNEINFYQHLKN